MAPGDPENDDRDAREGDTAAPGLGRPEINPPDRLEDADDWGKDVPERGHGEDIA